MNKELNQKMNKQMDAFFSVEAAMIMPLVISAILLAVGLFVFQYDRCLTEQDVAAQALKAAAVQVKTNEELTDKIQLQTAGLYRNKYVAWDIIMLDIKMKKGIIEAVGEGELQFPVPGWNFWNGKNIWNVRAGYKAHRLDPVSFIRNCRRIKSQIRDSR